MPEEKDLERRINKMVISKIIHTTNFSDTLAENLINELYNKYPYMKREDNANNTYWNGFTSDYIYSFKLKNNKDGTKDKILDKEFHEIFEKNKRISKIFKNTFVLDNGPGANPSYIDTFILPNLNFICIIGNKQVKRPETEIKNYLEKNNIKYEEINFTHDFLFWVLWKLYNSEDISNEISIDFFDNLRVGSSRAHNARKDNALNSIKTEGGGQELPSLPICYGLFNQKPLNHLKGEFIYNDKSFKFSINISKEGETEKSDMLIYSQRSLSGLMYSDKLQLVLPFLYKLSNVVKNWENSEDNKYPPIEYIEELFENAQDEYDEMVESYESYKENYQLKIDSD